MRFTKGAVWVVGGLLFCAPELHALKVEVGTFFVIDGVRVKNEQVILPTSRRKYSDIRMLDRDTFAVLQACKDEKVCFQKLAQAEIKLENIRPLAKQENKWLAEVNFGEKWLVVFLVFKDGNGVHIQAPAKFKFADNTFRQQVEQVIKQALI